MRKGRKKRHKDKKRYGGQKGNGKQKNMIFAVTILGRFFKSPMGRVSKSTEQYTPLDF